jgi:hypothetical protein
MERLRGYGGKMKRTLKELQQEVSNRVLELRAIDRIIRSESFQQVYTHEISEEILYNKNSLIKWIKEQKENKPYCEYTLRELRVVGRRFAIPDWHNKSKQILLSEIMNHVKQRNGSRDSAEAIKPIQYQMSQNRNDKSCFGEIESYTNNHVDALS